MKKELSNTARAAAALTLVNVVSLLFSFLQESVFAAFYGTSSTADAYTVAVQTPVVMFALISVAIHNVFIPTYSKLRHTKTPYETDSFVSNFMTVLLIVTLALVGISEIFADGLISIFAPGLDIETHRLTVDMFRMMLPTIMLSQMTTVCTGILHVHKSFILPALSSIFINVFFVIFIYIFSPVMGIYSAMLGHVIGIVAQCVYILIICRKRYRYRPRLNLRDKELIENGKRMIPIFIGIGADEINKIIDKMIASTLVAGSIVALNYASHLSSAIATLFITGISTVVYPSMTEAAAKDDRRTLSETFDMALSFFIMLFIPILAGGICLSEEIISVVFERGEFTAESVTRTAPLFIAYLACLLFTAFRQVSSRLFYALGDSKTPMINSVIGICINIVLNIILSRYLGALGLAIATATSIGVIAVLILISAKVKIKEISYKQPVVLLFKTVIASAVMFVVLQALIFLNNSLSLVPTDLFYGKLIFVIVSIAAGILVYVLALILMKTKEIRDLLGIFLRRKRRS